jgi:hypothetical protein
MQEDLKWDRNPWGTGLLLRDSPSSLGKGVILNALCTDQGKYVGQSWVSDGTLHYSDNLEELKALIYTMVRLG